MQLSEDEDDWTWGRWYWTQPLALPLPLIQAYGFPLWEKMPAYTAGGPQFFLAGGVYARSRVAIWPGQEYHGLPEWFANGLPREVRIDDGGGTVCGVATWQTDVGTAVDIDTGFPNGFLPVGGGLGVGGPVMAGGPCRIWYGACSHPAGGAAAGGPVTFHAGASLSAGGGVGAGGPVGFGEGASLSPGGGLAVGGAPPVSRGALLLPGGGLALGGAPPLARGRYLPAIGGGLAEGGPVVLGGSAPSTGPHFRSATHAARVTGTSTILAVPAGAVAGDVLYAFVTTSGGFSWNVPVGWTAVSTWGPGGLGGGEIFRHTVAGGDPSSWTFTGAASAPRSGVMVCISNVTGAPVTHTVVNGNVGTSYNTGSITPAATHRMLIAWVATANVQAHITTVTTFSPADDDTTVSLALWYLEDAPVAADTETYTGTLAGRWCSSMIEIP